MTSIQKLKRCKTEYNLAWHGFFWPGVVIGAFSLLLPNYSSIWFMAVALIWASAGVLVAEWIETHILWRLVRKDAKRRVDQYAARESFLYG